MDFVVLASTVASISILATGQVSSLEETEFPSVLRLTSSSSRVADFSTVSTATSNENRRQSSDELLSYHSSETPTKFFTLSDIQGSTVSATTTLLNPVYNFSNMVSQTEKGPYTSDTVEQLTSTPGTQDMPGVDIVVGNVQWGGINIPPCPVWSCEKRCFQRNKTAVESSPGQESVETIQSPASTSPSITPQLQTYLPLDLNTTDTSDVARCACDYSCIVLGDCCVDFFSICLNVTDEAEVIRILSDAQNSSGDVSDEDDMTVTNLIRSYGSCIRSPEGERYTMIASCPSSFPDHEVQRVCSEAEQHPSLQPHSDIHNLEITFRNIHCAMCHDYREDGLVPWVHGISCHSNVTDIVPSRAGLVPAESRDTSITGVVAAMIRSGDCMYIYRPPESSTTQPRTCFPSPAMVEDDLEQEDHHEPDVGVMAPESRCTTDDMLLCRAYYYQTFTSEDQEMKNPHCLKCLTGSTPVSVVSPCARGDTPDQNVAAPGILALFSRDPSSGAESIIVNGREIPWYGFRCEDDQVFDHVFLVCRDLFCSEGFIPASGECTPVDQLFIPASSQLVPEGTEHLHASFAMENNTSSCEGLRLLYEDTFRDSFVNAYYYHSKDISDSDVPRLDFFCMAVVSDTETADGENGTLSQIPVLDISVFPISNLSTTLNALADMIIRQTFHRYNSYSMVIRNYDKAKPDVECQEGNPQQINEANITHVDGEVYVERQERSIASFYPLTNTMFRLRLTASINDDSSVSIRKVYVAMLCVQPRVHSKLNCSSVAFDINQTRLENGTLYIKDSELAYPESQYELREGYVLVCSDFHNLNDLWYYLEFFQFTDAQIYFSWACSLTSVVCLVTSLVAFYSLAYLKTLAGYMTASLAGSLATGQVLILLDFDQPVVCSVLAAVCHFCWLAAFAWMTALAVQMSWTFFGKLSTNVGKQNPKLIEKNYRKYSVVCWGLPAALVATFFALDEVDGTPLKVDYGSPVCGWMRQSYVFLIPVAVTLSINVFCFLLTLVSIERLLRASQSALSRQQRRDRQRLVVYSKMFTAMGFTWAAGFAAAFTEEVALWWVYILLNGLQGTFIAFSFVLNARFVRALKAKFMAKKKDHGGVGSVDKGRGLSVGRCQNGACRNGVGWGRGKGCSDGNDDVGSGCDDWSGPRCDVHILSASSLTVETNVDM